MSKPNFVNNWIAGASDSRSMRRRLMAVLRLSSMAMGPSRKRLGLGSLGIAGASLAAAMSFAGPTVAQILQPDPSANVNLGGTLNSLEGGNSIAIGEMNVLEGDFSIGIGYGNSGYTGMATYIEGLGIVSLIETLTNLDDGTWKEGPGNTGDILDADGRYLFNIADLRDVDPSDPSTPINGHYYTGYASVAMGFGNHVAGDNSVGIGTYNLVRGDDSASIGVRNITEGERSFVLGTQNRTLSNDSVAIGTNNLVTGNNSLALGSDIIVSGDSSFAIGHGAEAEHEHSVALGSGSKTGTVTSTKNITLNGVTYAFAGADPIGTVSVGSEGNERTVTNLAAGQINGTSTDAINGSQLHATNQAVDQLKFSVEENEIHYFSVSDNGVQKSNYDNSGATGANSLAVGVGASASGIDSTAIGYDVHAVGTRSLAVGRDSGKGSTGPKNIAIGDGVGNKTISDANIAIGTEGAGSNVSNDSSITNKPFAITGNNIGIGGVAGKDVKGTANTALGWKAGQEADGHANIGVGTLAGYRANGNLNVGIGSWAGANVTGDRNVALGEGAGTEISANDTVSIGTKAKASGERSTALGYNSSAVGENSTALGFGSQSYGNDSTAIGRANVSVGVGSSAVGSGNYTKAYGSNAFGLSNIIGTDAQYASSFGVRNTVEGSKATVAGYENTVTGDDAVAVGGNNQVIASNAFAFGTNNNVSGANGLALGTNANVSGDSSIAIGNGAGTDTSTNDTISIGSKAKASGERSTALGYNSSAVGENSTALGFGSQSYGNDSTAIGRANVSVGVGSSAVGSGNYTKAYGSNAFGLSNIIGTNAQYASAFGVRNTVEGSRSIVAGYENTVTGDDAIALGGNNNVSGANGLALGTNTVVSGASGVAIGNGAQAEHENSVALGSGSITELAEGTENTTINGTTYNFAGTEPIGTVSIGSEGNERTITNLAAGRVSETSTDAVNGSQLHASNQAIEGLASGLTDLDDSAVKYDDDTKNSITLAGIISTDGGLTDGTRISNVAQGDVNDGSTDAINGTQLWETKQSIDAIQDGRSGIIQRVGAATDNRTVLTADGGDASNPGDAQVLANLADGRVEAGSNEAVNGGQLFGVSDSIVTHLGGGIVNPDGTITGPTYNIQGKTATTVKQAFEEVDDNLSTIHASLNNMNNGGGIKYFHANSSKADSVADGEDSVAVGPEAVANGDGSVAVGPEAVANGDGSVAMGAGAIADHDDSVALGSGSVTGEAKGTTGTTINGDSYDFAGTNPKGTVSVGDKDSERTITNVAAGEVSETSTDAVNGSQLHATNQAVEKLGDRVTEVEGDIVDIKGSITDIQVDITNIQDGVEGAVKYDRNPDGSLNKDSIRLEGQDGTKITNLQDGEIRKDSTDAVNGSQLYQTNEKIADLDDSAVKYKKNEDGSKSNEVVLEGGDPNAPVLISNVADGKIEQGSTEAVNGGQLYQVKTEGKNYTDQKFTEANSYTDQKFTEANNYTDSRFNQLSSEIGDVRKEARQAAAIGLAAASLRYDDRPGKLSAAIGGGYWRNEGAFALGMGYTSEDGRIRSNLSATTTGGHWGVGAGLSYTFN